MNEKRRERECRVEGVGVVLGVVVAWYGDNPISAYFSLILLPDSVKH